MSFSHDHLDLTESSMKGKYINGVLVGARLFYAQTSLYVEVYIILCTN